MEVNKNAIYRAIQKICYHSSYDKKNDIIYCRLFDEDTIFDLKNDKYYFHMTDWNAGAIKGAVRIIKHWYNSLDRENELSKTIQKYILEYKI